ncbi:MAG: ClpXP protease specificity-enhancing factor [Candidatus Endonucleobacter bathymodioli]|uniref:ClpXP protease specificity-enhancing factor n=1 Tax=Candidatus Endonucleibacter bathymodioli TaxID=539814 RepID=A0AA90NZ53_9GAMM|nr:ClpXP protease specificity-enhancing factor [Candidatus Endonucleobacter bathymodioli]
MTSSRPYIARALYEWILDNSYTPYILVDANCEDVVVPNEYVSDGRIVLNISPVAIRGLDIGKDFLSFDGRFDGRALMVFVPFEALMAIYAKENGQGMVFEVGAESMIEKPVDSGLKQPDMRSGSALESSRPKKPGRPSLKVVK